MAFPCTEVEISDVNGDGKPDIIARNSTGISVLLNTSTIGTISFAEKADIILGTGSLIVGDLDGDGRPDLCQQEGTDPLVISIAKNQCGEQAACTLPTGLNTINITSYSAKLMWDAVADVDGYQVRYRISGEHEWTSLITGKNAILLKGLIPNTGYAWQVRTVCSKNEPRVTSDWTAKQFFTTAALKLGDEEATAFKLYPNPTNGQFTLALTLTDEANAPAIIQVLNSLGQIVYNEKTSVDDGILMKEIDLNGISSGMYLVRVVVNNQVFTARLSYQQ